MRTALMFEDLSKVDADNITMTVVEKKVDSGIRLGRWPVFYKRTGLQFLRRREDIYYCF
jgi:hypothetical protein